MTRGVVDSVAVNARATEFRWPLRVYYEDTDASGVVYHANYLKYFERARTEWLRTLGFDQARLHAEQGVAFTLASATVDFRAPARLDDHLEVLTAVVEHRRASLVFSQTVLCGETRLAEGRFRVGCVDSASFRPRAMPAAIITALEERTE